MAKETFWKIWLRPNQLTKDVENDFNAEVSTTGKTLKNEDIARRVVAGRSELRYETILSILHERDEIVRDALAQGTAVQDGCLRIAPRVFGAWIGASHAFDPTVHKIGLDATPSAEMRAVLETIGVEVLGEKDSGAFIGRVTDVSTDKTDGTITPDEDVIVAGDKIRIAPDDEPGLGVFFVDESGMETQVTHKFTENNPKKLIFRVPALADGVWRLKVVTRYTNGKMLLHEPRTITYEFPLTVGQPPSP
jgi:hypothetical protein